MVIAYTAERLYRARFADIFANRLEVRGFHTLQDRDNFLNTRDNSWRVSSRNLRPGTYAYAGEQWRNIKTLDRLALTHF
jgi:hypothetical protein